jgi:hypothetical protein
MDGLVDMWERITFLDDEPRRGFAYCGECLRGMASTAKEMMAEGKSEWVAGRTIESWLEEYYVPRDAPIEDLRMLSDI